LGEDASFDIEFARKFNAKVIIVDPTPRAIRHFEEIEERLGMESEGSYAEGGRQPATSYELSGVVKGQLTIEPAALWTEADTLKFFLPNNPAHVSHSLVNLHNSGAPDAAYIEVPAITYTELIAKNSLISVPLVKMDIEGAETAVIAQMMDAGHRPRQLLLEYDELLSPSAKVKSAVEECHRLLTKCGYRCFYYDGTSNFLYIHGAPQPLDQPGIM